MRHETRPCYNCEGRGCAVCYDRGTRVVVVIEEEKRRLENGDFFSELESLLSKYDASISSIGNNGSSLKVSSSKWGTCQIDHSNCGGDAVLNKYVCAGHKYK